MPYVPPYRKPKQKVMSIKPVTTKRGCALYLRVNIHCSSQTRTKNIGNRLNVKRVVSIPWPLVCLSRKTDFAESQRNKTEKFQLNLTRAFVPVDKGFVSPHPAVFCFASIRHPTHRGRGREKGVCQKQRRWRSGLHFGYVVEGCTSQGS